MAAYDGTIRIDSRVDTAGFNKGVSKIGGALRGIGKVLAGAAIAGMVAFVAVLAVVASIVRALISLGKATLDAAGHADKYLKSFDELKVMLNNVKLAIADAFRPLVLFALPWIKEAVAWVQSLLYSIASVVASMTGQGGYWKSTAKAADSTAASSKKVADNTKKAGEAAEGALAAFDELNVLQMEKGSEETAAGGGGGGGGVGLEWVEVANEAFKIDWGALGKSVSDGAISALTKAREAIQNFDFKSIGTNIAKFINEIDWPTILGQTAGLLSDSLKGILDFMIGFVQELDWKKLGSDIWNSIVQIVTEIDWGGILSKIFELLGSALAGITTLIISFASEMWKSFNENVVAYFEEHIQEAGGDVWQGFLNGIVEAMLTIGSWIAENILEPFIKGFKEAWGISSPSRVMAGLGKDIIEGLKQGIKNTWTNLSGWVNSVIIEPLKSWFKEAGTNIADSFTTSWENIKKVWAVVTSWFKDKIIDPVVEEWNTATGKIKGFFTTTFTDIKETIRKILNDIIDFVNKLFRKIADGINTVITSFNSITGLKLAMVKAPEIPKLATGAVIPPNAQFLAMLGDQRHGTNIEAPEELIRQIVREEGGGGREITINFAGSLGALVRELKPYIDSENDRIGRSLVKRAVA